MGAGCLDFVGSTLLAKRKYEFVVAGHWQHGKVVLRRCLHGTLDNSKIMANIFEVCDDDFRVKDRIRFVLVDGGVQRNDINVQNFLVPSDLVQQL